VSPAPQHGPRPSGPHSRLARGWHSRGYLPHFDSSSVIQSVTYRLADALPSRALVVMERRLNAFDDEERRNRLRSSIDRYLDAGRGACLLRRPAVAQAVIDTWRYFDGRRYRLHAWVVMPNHVHVLVETGYGYGLPAIVGSWKTFTARAINRLFSRSGPVWMPDYWDRFVRDETHYRRVVAYIRQNPVKAGLVDAEEGWRWSWVLGGV
jgi:REP element-mobilizing transposase RayT